MSEFTLLYNSSAASPHTFLGVVADICGWLYLLIWGSYMYPQVFLNYKLQSVEGFKLDYPFLNLSGYIFITVCNTTAFFHEFPFKNYGLGNVRVQDVLYALNGTFVCIILNLQAVFYPRGKNTITMFSFFFTVFAWISVIIFFLISEVYDIIPPSQGINILVYLGDAKILVNVIKYVPLIYFNFLRKTTEGMSIVAFALNLAGATFSLLQMGLDYHNGTTDTINPVKTALAAVTIFYDIILVFQYFTYRNYKNKMEASLMAFPSDETSANEKLLQTEAI